MHTSDTNETRQFYKAEENSAVAVERPTFITPFIAVSFLSLPSLLVIAYSKETVGYSALILSGFYTLVMAFLWILVPLSALFALLYIWRGKSHTAKVAVMILTVVLVSSFLYVVWPVK